MIDFSSMFTILSNSWIGEVLDSICLSLLGAVYNLVAYVFRLFSLMCQINFTSLYSIISPLIDRLEALVMVLILFKGGVALIGYLMNPDSFTKDGKQLLKNIAIVVALLLSYNFIFDVLNELSMLIIGYPEDYQFTRLPDLIEIEEGGDAGLISRFIFGDTDVDVDMGDYVAYQTLSIFVEASDDSLKNAIVDGDEIDFRNLANVAPYVGKTVKYTKLLGTVIGIYMIYCVAKATIEIGVRMFKLIVLQLLAPVAIVSIIKDGTKGSIFQKFIKKYTSTYLDAFTRMASMLIMIVFISKFFSNLSSFFSESSFDTAGGGLTEGLLKIIVVVAGFRFVGELPKFVDELLGTHMADSKGGFGSYIGGLIGGTIGGAAGIVTTALNGGSFGTGVANMISGQVQGFSAGAKGNTLSEKIKNVSGSVGKINNQASDWTTRGGFGNVALGTIGSHVGIKSMQDKKIEKYDKQLDAIKQYEDAQKAIIADNKMSATDMVLAADGTGEASAEFLYSAGFDTEKLTDNKDTYIEKMLRYDNELRAAQASYDAARTEDGKKAAAKELAEAQFHARKRAGDYYDAQQDKASSSTDDRILTAKKNTDKYGIDVSSSSARKDAKKNIEREKRLLTNKDSYINTHSGKK